MQDALTIGPVLLSAAAENSTTAKQVLDKLMEIFCKEFDPSEEANLQGSNADKISKFYARKLAVKETGKIQQFIELCIECNYEANAGDKFTSKLVKTLFPNGRMYFFGIAPYPAVALGYFMSHVKATDESASPIKYLQLHCAPHPCDPQVLNVPGRQQYRDKMKEVKYVPSDDEVREDVEKWKENEKRKHGNLHKALDKLPPSRMLAYIETIQECDGLPSISDTNIEPVIKSFSNSSIKITDFDMDNYKKGFDELLQQIQDGHMESLRILNVPRTTSSGDQTTKLSNMVHKLPNIEVLTICRNHIEKGKTLPALAQNLPNCKALLHLKISENNISADDMNIFAEKLPLRAESNSPESDEKFGHRLQSLFIRGNYINDQVATILSERLPQTLTNLGISVGGKDLKDLSPERHRDLLKALQDLPNLKKLHIYDSPYPSDLVKCVFEGLPSWNKMWGLTLDAQGNEDDQPMSPDVCKIIVESLNICPAISQGELRLSGIYLPEGFFKTLMETGKKKKYSCLV